MIFYKIIMVKHKPRQLTYTNTISNMNENIIQKSKDNYNDIKNKYEKRLIENNKNNNDIFNFIKDDKLNDFIEYFNSENMNIRRRKDFLKNRDDDFISDVIEVFTTDFDNDDE